jgi:hypothetical protein
VDRQYVRFTRRDVREATEWGDTQLKVHMKRLEDLEYLLVHRTRGPLVHYELRYGGEGKDGRPFLLGLDAYDRERPGRVGPWSALGRGPVGPRSAAGRIEESATKSEKRTQNGAVLHPPSEIMTAVTEASERVS